MKKQMLLALWLPLIAITVFTNCKKSGSESAGPYQIRSYNDGYQFGGMVDGQEFIPNGSSGLFGGWPAIKSTYWVPSIGGSIGTERDFFAASFIITDPIKTISRI